MSSSVSNEAPATRSIDIVNRGLKRRYDAEKRFRIMGLGAVLLGLAFVGILFTDIISKGLSAFVQTHIQLEVAFDEKTLDNEDARSRIGSYFGIAKEGIVDAFPHESSRSLYKPLLSYFGAPEELRQMVLHDPDLIGTRQKVWVIASDDVDMLFKGESTDIVEQAPEGIASPTGTDGKIEVYSTVNDFSGILADVKRLLDKRADQIETNLKRIDRRIESLTEDRDRLLEAGADNSQLTILDKRIEELNSRRDETAALAADYHERVESPGAVEKLSGDMPSYLVAINGGVVKATSVGSDRISGEVLLPLESTADATTGNWRLLEYTLPEDDRQLKDRAVTWAWSLKERGLIQKRFNARFFAVGTSTDPELAGIAAALVGSFYTLLLTLLFSFPIAVGAALYLEEFAPKNWFTDIIEVNINNLAAVPSIVFGLLGLAVFIGFFGVPRSTPLVGALVLTLMTLPTIIIASRAALKSVPPSIREAALGVGASCLQTRFHHVLPLALPGMLTGTIIGMAQALGETAPLLMVGLNAQIVDIPGGPVDQATVLPVQIFMWAGGAERGFVERTSAAIMVLLAFLITMNLTAVLLRKRFERRW